MSEPEAAGKRPYRMKARAEAAEATRGRILDAGEAAFDELPLDGVTLAEIAKRAGVSVQTIIRHFGTKEGLFLAVLVHTGAKMGMDRQVEPGAEVEEVVGVLVDHYERFGQRILRMLAEEDRVPNLNVFVDIGRAYHLEWCKQAFRPALKGLRGARRTRRAAQLAAVTDIYVWKILRRDRSLSVAQTKVAIREMLAPLTGAHS
jgi:AcrR family transcriptional regulator